MPTSRVYTYRATPDGKASQASIVAGMIEMGALISKHNQHVEEVKIQTAGPEIEIILTMKGHDQWWIKKKVIFPIASILAKAGLKIDQARLISVDLPEDGRKTRVRSKDGSHNLPDPDLLVPHDIQA